jgi:hypothetical protein
MSAQAREITFRKQRKALEQAVRDDRIENGITEELESLIVRRTVAAVCQGRLQKRTIAELVAKSLLESRVPHRP